jgi:hypothetical protein
MSTALWIWPQDRKAAQGSICPEFASSEFLTGFVSQKFPQRWILCKTPKARDKIAILHTPSRGLKAWNPLPLLLRKFTAGSI